MLCNAKWKPFELVYLRFRPFTIIMASFDITWHEGILTLRAPVMEPMWDL